MLKEKKNTDRAILWGKNAFFFYPFCYGVCETDIFYGVSIAVVHYTGYNQ